MTARFWLLIGVCAAIIILAIPWWLEPVDNQIALPAVTGDAIYVRTNKGRRILIDTGNDAPHLLEFIGHYTPFWQKNIVDDNTVNIANGRTTIHKTTDRRQFKP